MKIKPAIPTILALALCAAGHIVFYYGFVASWNFPLYAISILLFGAGLSVILWGIVKKRPVAIVCGVLFAALLFGVATACRTVWDISERNVSVIFFAITAAAFLVCLVLLRRKTGKPAVWQGALALLLCAALSLIPYGSIVAKLYYIWGPGAAAAPTGFGSFTELETALADDADLYISPDGSDDADGSFEHPLATIEKARDLVREMDKTGRTGVTVALKAGEYPVKQIEFTAEDGGTESCPITYRAYGDGEVILNGGKTLDPASFTAVQDGETLSRLSADAKKNVVCADLTKLGLTAADWGKLYSVGGYSTASHYDGDTTGPVPCVLYYNGAPMTTARYPDSGTLKVVSVVREGVGRESSTSNHSQLPGWDEMRNPETTIFTVDPAVAKRVNGYASLDNVWLWTALMYNWADGTSPLKSFNYEERTMEPAYVSVYGAVPGSDYYIFNVIEELDSPGEWYLDRDTGMVYLYPEGDLAAAQLSLSLSVEDLICVTGADHLRFEGLSVRGTRGSGFRIEGNDILISDCLISELSGIGVVINGYDNTVENCEFAHIGAAGADIAGGDRETLTPGNNRVENCLFHHYSEVAFTAGPGVNLNGVGNVCAHNEFHDSPQQAIFYCGNDMLIEYNLMYDVALKSDDCSAVYAGRRWDCGGCVVRYNAMYHVGDKKREPNGIYWDDGLSGQTAYGNLIVGVKSNGFLIGGGRDNCVYNNVLINCSTPVCYDERALDGALHEESWFKHSREGADMQQNLEAMPWRGEIWQKAYPYTADWSLDYSDTENPNFIPNPANSKVSGNLIVQYEGSFGSADESVYRYSDLSGNAIYKLNALKKLFVDPENGDYTLRDDAPVFDEIPGFEQIPISEIGRY
ncbi:MAG: right-handed parallel beta-helix repeat-containing protein [Clostridia bacterium]|nr:right-handed parallel beta-helix repeat-containing protein [Clostridia bacterium]